MNEKEELRIMIATTLLSAQDSIKYATEMYNGTRSALDLPRINGTIEYLKVTRRRTKDAIKLLRKFRKT